MGNSTRTLQSVVDTASTIGDLTPVLKSTGGFSREPALSIANTVMRQLIAERFNWKWNRLLLRPFNTISLQQDYPGINVTGIGWLENRCRRVDINNTQHPKPTFPIEAVRDLPMSAAQYGWPAQICWLPNSQLQKGVWPGAGVNFTNPLGAVYTPTNPLTNFIDANQNLLVLVQFGKTGVVAPAAPALSAPGTAVSDGTCIWQVAAANGQGFRIDPMPPAQGNVWMIYPVAQAAAPTFTALSQTLDPIPDDYSQWFEDGFIAYAHRHSTDPKIKAQFPQMKAMWEESLLNAKKQGDREEEAAGFYPTRGIVQNGNAFPVGPAWPYGERIV